MIKDPADRDLTEGYLQSDGKHTTISIRSLVRDLAGAILAGFLLLLFTNRGVLLHARGEAAFRPSGIWTAESTDSTVVVSRDGSVHATFDAFETGIYVSRLSFELENTGERPLPVSVRVSCLEGDGIVTYEYTDFQPLYLGNEVLKADLGRVVAVDICRADTLPDGTDAARTAAAGGQPEYRVGAIRIDNRFLWDPYVLLFGFLAAFAFFLLIDHRELFRRQPAAAFCLIALTTGLCMVSGLPRNKIGYDEETHLQAVIDMASFPSGELHISDALMNQLLITEYNHPDAQPGNAAEMSEWDGRLAVLADYREGPRTPDFYTLPNRMPAYLAMAAAMKLGKGLHLSWPKLLMMTRAANLLLYTALMTLAIWLCPCGKWLMMLIGLFPVNLFLACTVSYDPYVTAFLSLGFSFVQKGRRYVLPALACIFLGCLPKAVYAPVAMLPLIWLRRKTSPSAELPSDGAAGDAVRKAAEDGKDRTSGSGLMHRQNLQLVLACFVCFLLLAGAFILPTVLSPAEAGDMRGGATSEVFQVGFILGDPVRYTFILLRQIFRWIPQCWFGADCTTHMGHIVNGSTAFKGYYPAYLIMLAAAVILSWIPEAKGDLDTAAAKPALHIPARIWTFLMVGAASALVWTSMYVAFTEPGAEEIAGVQGRYFIPLMFPLYMVISGPGKGGSLETGHRLWYYLLESAELLFMVLTIWTTVISRFCL